MVKKARKPLKFIPAIILACGILKRPGLSSIATTARIIERLPEVGIPNGVNADGTPNLIAGYTNILVEEILREIRINGVVQGAMLKGSGTFYGQGTSPVGPITVTVSNIMDIPIKGIVS